MIYIKRTTDEERINNIRTLFTDEQEIQSILEYDKTVERGEKTEYDLPKEKQKIAQKYCRTGTRKVEKKPTAFKWDKRTRKPNEIKREFIEKLTAFIKEYAGVSNLEIVNPERQIFFMIGDQGFDITLIQKTKKTMSKKGLDNK